MSAKEFRCPCCDTIGQWKNMDHVRLKKFNIDKNGVNTPINMSACQSCGMINYPDKYQTEEQIKEFYRSSYRPAPQAPNLFTGERKLQYHVRFLNPIFENWRKKGITQPVIGEIGSAYGMFLNWIKGAFPESYIHGTELTSSYKRVAFHEYDIKLEDDFDTSKKYDLISSYHVLEHQLDPDKRLAEYAACLKDDGVFYLSCPVWFRDASNSATGGFDIDYYWATDHINCWSEQHLEYIIAKANLEIVTKDVFVYGNTYILKKSSQNVMRPKWDPKKCVEAAESIFKCWQLIQENKTAESIQAWPNCPSAWINHYELHRSEFHKSRAELDIFIKDSVSACPNSADVPMFVGDILSRYERYDESLEALKKALHMKPNNPTIIMAISNCHRMKSKKETDPVKKEKLLRESINLLRFVMSTSTEMMPQALTWAYQDMSNLPKTYDSPR